MREIDDLILKTSSHIAEIRLRLQRYDLKIGKILGTALAIVRELLGV